MTPPPLVIRYEAMQLDDGRWGILERVVRHGCSSNQVSIFCPDEDRAIETASLLQRANDLAQEEWRTVVADLDSERQDWKDQAERVTVELGTQRIERDAVRDVGLKIRLSRSLASNEVWVSTRDVDLASRLSRILGVAPEPA